MTEALLCTILSLMMNWETRHATQCGRPTIALLSLITSIALGIGAIAAALESTIA